MHKYGVTIGELSKRVGVARSTIRYQLRGRLPDSLGLNGEGLAAAIRDILAE